VTLFNGSTFHQNNASGYGGALVYIHECYPGATNTSIICMLWKILLEFTAFGACDIV